MRRDGRVQLVNALDPGVLDPRVLAHDVDQLASGDSGRLRTDHIDRVQVARKQGLMGRDAEALQRDMENTRIGFGNADYVRINDDVEKAGQAIALRIPLDVAIGVGNHAQFKPRVAELLKLIDYSRTYDAPQRLLLVE